MSDDLNKLIQRLRATFFEERDFSLHDVRDAANALEALAAECDLVRSSMRSAVAERDRLKDEVERLRNEKVGTHGSPELDDDARKLAAMGQDPGATLATEPAPAVCEWRPIQIAPTDGTLICGAWMYGRRWATKSLFWNGHNWECPISDGYFAPTHWMPLPQPEAKG